MIEDPGPKMQGSRGSRVRTGEEGGKGRVRFEGGEREVAEGLRGQKSKGVGDIRRLRDVRGMREFGGGRGQSMELDMRKVRGERVRG